MRREDTYSELLISIAAYEKKIEELKKNNDALLTKVHSLKEKNVPIEKPKTEKEHEHNQLIEVNKENLQENNGPLRFTKNCMSEQKLINRLN